MEFLAWPGVVLIVGIIAIFVFKQPFTRFLINILLHEGEGSTWNTGQKERYMRAEKKILSEEILQKIVPRVVEVAKPEKIIVFGFAARGKMGPNSDVDLLVVKKGKYNRSRLAGDIYMNLHGVGQAVDVIVVTPEDVERYRDTHCLIIKPALQEGREVYHA